ncbi:MAG: phage minor head protein [Bacteroidota bacterium]|nr:phage minor head protein [Bacteroidota bacterium]
MYNTSCGCDFDIVNKEASLFTDEEIAVLLSAIYQGYITEELLDVNLYARIGRYLEEGVVKGFGKTVFELTPNDPDFETALKLRENVYAFSAAKTFQQTKDMSAAVYEDGVKIPFSDFKKKASAIFEDYNNNWLKTEYNMAVSQARSAKLWSQYQNDKQTLPYLKYDTIGDGRVRYDHRILDGIIKRVDDKFWNRWMPPNDWGCRCHVRQLDEGDITDTSTLNLPEQGKLFRGNPGKTKLVFNESHPYFKVDQKYRLMKEDNFNLPKP